MIYCFPMNIGSDQWQRIINQASVNRPNRGITSNHSDVYDRGYQVKWRELEVPNLQITSNFHRNCLKVSTKSYQKPSSTSPKRPCSGILMDDPDNVGFRHQMIDLERIDVTNSKLLNPSRSGARSSDGKNYKDANIASRYLGPVPTLLIAFYARA